MTIIRTIGNSILALWILVITTGILVNKHYSGHTLYSSALYVEADKCCHEKFNDHSLSTCHGESSCHTDNSIDLDDTYYPIIKNGLYGNLTEEDCCNDLSLFIVLTELFRTDKSDMPIVPVQPIIKDISCSQIDFSQPFSYKIPIDPSPPPCTKISIPILINSFLC